MTFLLGSKQIRSFKKLFTTLGVKDILLPIVHLIENLLLTRNEINSAIIDTESSQYQTKKYFIYVPFYNWFLFSFTTVASNSNYNTGNGRELQQQLTTTCYRDWIMSSPTTFGHIKLKFSLSNFKIELFHFLTSESQIRTNLPSKPDTYILVKNRSRSQVRIKMRLSVKKWLLWRDNE